MSLAHLHSWKVFSKSEGKTRTSERKSVKPQVEGTVLEDIFDLKSITLAMFTPGVHTTAVLQKTETLGNPTGPVLVTS